MRGQRWSEREMGEALHRFVEVNGRSPTMRELETPTDRSWPSKNTLVRRFGSVHAAFRRFGLEPRPPGKRDGNLTVADWKREGPIKWKTK